MKPNLMFEITCNAAMFSKMCLCMCLVLLQGKLKFNEVVFDGFESMYDAFVSLFKGTNIGKVVVKV